MRLPNDEILAQNAPEIDLILGGHDHFIATKTINDTLIAKSGEDFQNITVIQLWHQSGKKPKVIPQIVPITRNFAEDPEMVQLVKFYQDVMMSKMNKSLAYNHVVLDASVENVRTREANIGIKICKNIVKIKEIMFVIL
jgi:2',3'-cyclic-nucleotide 2'-phosphodiesterase (5'-nucleotidase family)